jgi:hypothetical protein
MNKDIDPGRFDARIVWERDGLRVSVTNTSPGGVYFEVRNVPTGVTDVEESGYSITVSGDDTWNIISELPPGTGEPVDLIAANIAEIMETGIGPWLESIGIVVGPFGPLSRPAPPRQSHESRCWNPECDFEGGTVDITIDYRTPYETGYTWICPKCGMKIETEYS